MYANQSKPTVAIATALALFFWSYTSLAQNPDLPGEQVIPGTPIIGLENLPPEAAIPGERLKPTLPTEATLPATSSRRVNPDLENQDVVDPQPREADQQDAIQEFAKRPLLRILADGPIAPLQTIRFSRDSNRILAGGQGKSLHVWRLLKRPGEGEKWVHEKQVYWQINRATQGQIFSVAAGKDVIAFGGIGASASNGEIALIDAKTLEFTRALVDLKLGHVDSISAIATTGTNSVITSTDVVGRVIVWRRDDATGQWQAQLLRRSDNELYGEPAAQDLFQWRSRGGALAVDSQAVFFPELIQPYQIGEVPSWDVVRADSNGNKMKLTAPEPHRGMVAGIACSADGKRVVSADIRNNGRVFVWEVNNGQPAQVIETGFPVRCVDISPNGTKFAFGTARNSSQPAQVKIFEWPPDQPYREIGRWNESTDVEACAFNADGSRLAYTQGPSVVVRKTAGDQTAQKLDSKIGRPYQVAFSSTERDYRIAFRGKEDDKYRWSFDPGKLNLIQLPDDDASTWVSANPRGENWKLNETVDVNGRKTYAVMVDNVSFCNLPIDPNRVGEITTWAFDASRVDATVPATLIIGTGGKNHLYVYRIAKGQCDLIREYRGHTAAVSSVGISADKKYLVSAAQDGSIQFWKIDATDEQNAVSDTKNRWGAEFEIRDERLVAKTMIKDGPLYFRGVRTDDIIEQVAWRTTAAEQKTINDPKEMLERLRNATTDNLIRFEYRRGAAQQPYFYLYPAWQPLATLAWDQDREWAFWTPYGYYDASFNGHKFFGWQINRGVNRPVDFFRAAELKEDLERPRMMQNLLSEGSVEDAFRLARIDLPQNLSDRLSAIERLKPKVRIVRAETAPQKKSKSAQLLAQVELPQGVDLARVKAFANGVPATGQKLVNRQSNEDSQILDYQFEFDLPSDSRIKLQVLASSNLGHGAMAETEIDGLPMQPEQTSRVFFMSLGVSNYQDSQIPKLDFADVNAEQILESLSGSRMADERTVLLTDAEANKGMWMITSHSLAEEMKRIARPDDLLIIFLSGHGFRDPVTEEYFYLTADSKYADVLSRRYGDCISFDDLHAFGDIPCRKVVILDTCHGGSLQVLRQQNLKSVVRTLENDLFFTLTASEGSQEAYESKQRGMGLFTSRLVDALAGQSDQIASGGNGDGAITLREVINFVKATVPDDAARLGNYQFPTASPVDVLEWAEIPLTVVGQ